MQPRRPGPAVECRDTGPRPGSRWTGAQQSGDKFQGQDLLYLTTVGAKTGQKRQTTVARFPDGEDAWLVVASAAGSADHPAWYHNIAAHPNQVWIESGRASGRG